MPVLNRYTPARALTGPEVWPVVQDGITVDTTASQMASLVGLISTDAARAGWANLQDYHGTDPTDAAAAMRNAIASGKKVIYVPPGNYVCKSAVTTYGSATNPSCFELRGLNDVWILAYGAVFTVSNPILINDVSAGSIPVTICSITANSKHCGIVGARLDGNYTGLSGGAENVGINLASVTDATVRDVKLTGEFLAAISGVYVYDSLIDNVHAYKNAIGIDIAHVENLVVHRSRFEANPGNPVTGINQHYDVATLGDNSVTNEDGTVRTLQGGRANRLKVLDSTFVGFGNSIAMEAMHHATVARNTIRGRVIGSANAQCGILLYCGAAAVAAGQSSVDTFITDNEITGCGNSAGGAGSGIFLGSGVSRVQSRDNRIFDNTGYGITAQDLTPTAITSIGDDFDTRNSSGVQLGPWPVSLDALIAAALGQGATDAALTITHGIGASFGKPWTGSMTGGPICYIPNNVNLTWYDSHGNPKPIIGVSPGDDTFLRAAADTSTIRAQSASGADWLWANAAGTKTFGGLGVFGANPPSARPVVTGSRGGNAALTSLLVALAATGLLTDGTTA